MHSLYVPYAINMKKMKYNFYYIVLYIMTYARNMYVFQVMYLQTMPYLKWLWNAMNR